jgi:hypothetical protein
MTLGAWLRIADFTTRIAGGNAVAYPPAFFRYLQSFSGAGRTFRLRLSEQGLYGFPEQFGSVAIGVSSGI